jgi:hypothetical protein
MPLFILMTREKNLIEDADRIRVVISPVTDIFVMSIRRGTFSPGWRLANRVRQKRTGTAQVFNTPAGFPVVVPRVRELLGTGYGPVGERPDMTRRRGSCHPGRLYAQEIAVASGSAPMGKVLFALGRSCGRPPTGGPRGLGDRHRRRLRCGPAPGAHVAAALRTPADGARHAWSGLRSSCLSGRCSRLLLRRRRTRGTGRVQSIAPG